MHAILLMAILAMPQADTTKTTRFTGDAGLVNLSGNTSLTTVNLGDRLESRSGAWSVVQLFSVVYGRNDSMTTTSLWQGSLRGERAITPHVGLFVMGAYDRNTFAGVQARYAPQLGVAAKLITTDTDKLYVDIGAGYTILHAVDSNDHREFASGRVAGFFTHALSSKAVFSQSLEFLPDFEISKGRRVNSETAITAPISSGISMKASYAIRYNGAPAAAFKKTDRILTTGLQVTF